MLRVDYAQEEEEKTATSTPLRTGVSTHLPPPSSSPLKTRGQALTRKSWIPSLRHLCRPKPGANPAAAPAWGWLLAVNLPNSWAGI
ncbi:MAG: hypothetical protein M5U34_36325 [Chloroflexi bacterium]|nr:hypothetical protein [Chloroflexota bacterium]